MTDFDQLNYPANISNLNNHDKALAFQAKMATSLKTVFSIHNGQKTQMPLLLSLPKQQGVTGHGTCRTHSNSEKQSL